LIPYWLYVHQRSLDKWYILFIYFLPLSILNCNLTDNLGRTNSPLRVFYIHCKCIKTGPSAGRDKEQVGPTPAFCVLGKCQKLSLTRSCIMHDFALVWLLFRFSFPVFFVFGLRVLRGIGVGHEKRRVG